MFDITDRVHRAEPVPDSWLVTWHLEPVRPAGLSDEDWELRIECDGHELARARTQRCWTRAEAMRLARKQLAVDWFGCVNVQRQVPDEIEHGIMQWEDAGDVLAVD